MDNQYWQHKASGEVFAVQIENDEVFSACGPLHYDEVTSENLKAWNFNNEQDLTDDLNEHKREYAVKEGV